MLTKFYSKKQLAVIAGVSRTTFYRWMLEDQHEDPQEQMEWELTHHCEI